MKIGHPWKFCFGCQLIDKGVYFQILVNKMGAYCRKTVYFHIFNNMSNGHDTQVHPFCIYAGIKAEKTAILIVRRHRYDRPLLMMLVSK